MGITLENLFLITHYNYNIKNEKNKEFLSKLWLVNYGS